MITNAQVRQGLMLLHRPDRLASTVLARVLGEHGLVPARQSPMVVGTTVSHLLLRGIARLRRPSGAARPERLPHLVLTTCFVHGSKLAPAAEKLQMSQRQLTRERAWAIALLRAEIERRLVSPAEVSALYPPEPIPPVQSELSRPDLIRELASLLEVERLVVVTGAAGVGKTSLVAAVARAEQRTVAPLWYRFRRGLNDTSRPAGALSYRNDIAQLNSTNNTSSDADETIEGPALAQALAPITADLATDSLPGTQPPPPHTPNSRTATTCAR